MADNVAITPGAGATIAADEVTDATLGSVKVQYVKLMDGTIDGTAKASVGANGLRVDPSGVTQTVTISGPSSTTGTTSIDGATLVKVAALVDLLPQVLIELKLISELLNESLLSHSRMDLAAMRSDLAYPDNTSQFS